jgi:hypothetical protein
MLLVASSLLLALLTNITILGPKKLTNIPLAAAGGGGGLLLSVAFHLMERWAAQAHGRMHRKMGIDDIADVYKY